MALMHEDFFTLGGIFTLAGFVVEEFYCIDYQVIKYVYPLEGNHQFAAIYFLIDKFISKRVKLKLEVNAWISIPQSYVAEDV